MFRGRCLSTPDFHPMATEAGVVATLYKPLPPNELVQAVTGAMGAQRTEDAAIVPPLALAAIAE